jgi:hypothetical protein
MKQQMAAATFLILSLFAIFSMKEPAGAAPGRLVLAGGGCPVPLVSPLTN